ncbi:MAG TPA: YdcF family protein [Kiloniellales bacterium]|nr:YdcF family protein [Kiloniellales bacterium]
MARRPSRTRRTLWLLPLLALGLLLFDLLDFAERLPREAEAPKRPTDAIVVLTGGAGRIDRGFELLESGLAERLFISGVYRGVEVGELLRLAQRSPDEMRCCIELGYEASNTRGNARETAAWARAHKIGSLRLVTTAYHLPRARLELARSLPEVEILMEPVALEAWRDGPWWGNRRMASTLSQEYLKYLAARLRTLPQRAVGYVSAGNL